MIVQIHDRLTRKYAHAPHTMVNPYSEVRNGHLYLVSEDERSMAILCDAIVDIKIV